MSMKLIVGLGNPGRKYDGTRHNVGWCVLDELARRGGATGTQARFHGRVADVVLSGQRTLLLWPETYMNRSGTSVLAARDFYKIPEEDILIVCDDFHLPLAKLRVRSKGSDGGNNGLADVIRRLGTDEVPRLRIGVGEPPPEWNAADYVLSKFTKDERPMMAEAVERAADAVAFWAAEGTAACMNRFN